MAPVATAQTTLTYPIYASDFDPNNSDLLLVGGGGGESRSGVGNKITLLDTTRKQSLAQIVDIDLSRDEDSVMSLAIAQSTDCSAVAFAGINSSAADQNAGRNEHLRSFELQYPPRRKRGDKEEKTESSESKTNESSRALGRTSLFTASGTAKKEAYQRVLRLSPPKHTQNNRLGVIATSLEPEGEIVAFDASQRQPTAQDVRRRIRLKSGQEAADVDILPETGGGYFVAYCTDFEVYITKIASSAKAAQTEPNLICETPQSDASNSTAARPKFRSLRFLQPNLLLVLRNKINRGGAELLVLDLPSPQSLGIVIVHKSLHKAIKAATALSVCKLPASVPSENAQSAIAVAGQDNSISVFTLDHPQQRPIPILKLRTHTVLRDVHTNLITSLTFANFYPPSHPATALPQYIKLASTSIGTTVVVHTFPLLPYPPPSRTRTSTRYVLKAPGRSEGTQIAYSLLISAFVIAVGAFLLQAFTEIRGGTPEYLGAKGWLNEHVHDWIARPYMSEGTMPKPDLAGEIARSANAAQSKAADSVKNAEEQVKSIKIPGVDDLKVPGVEPNPIEGLQSVAAEVTGSASDQAEKAKDAIRGAAKEVSDSVNEATEQVSKGAETAQKKLGLRHLLSQRSSSSSSAESATSENSPSDILVQHDENSKSLSTDVRDVDSVIGDAHKKWEDLEAHERETWKRRLIDAGEWAVEEGEAVLKGVFFQNIAMAVGAAVGQGVG